MLPGLIDYEARILYYIKVDIRFAHRGAIGTKVGGKQRGEPL
jgi:hypothetical protein